MTVAAEGNLPSSTLAAAPRRLRPRALRLAFGFGVVAAVCWAAPDDKSCPALAILTLTLVGIFLGPKFKRVPSHVWAPAIGAGAVLLVPLLSQALFGVALPRLGAKEIATEMSGRLAVPVLILSLSYLSLSLDASGFFEWFSLEMVRFGAGSGRRLLASVFVGVSLMTFFTSNDIVILSVTPVLIYLGRHARLQNLTPFLLAQFVAANTASMGLYIGNPTNVVIGSAVGVGFMDYAARMFVPTVTATLVSFALVWILFVRLKTRYAVPTEYHLPGHVEAIRWSSHMTLKAGLFFACLLTLAVLGTPEAVRALLGEVGMDELRRRTALCITGISLSFALMAALYDAWRERAGGGEMRARLARLPLEIVPFFISFCLILRAIADAGLVERAAAHVVRAFEHGPVFGSVASGAYGILLVNTTNNIPATLFFEKAWLGNASAIPPVIGLEQRLLDLHPNYPDIFVDVCLYASNFGANLTFIGALAGLMWLRIIQKEANRWSIARVPSARDFLICGAVLVPIVTIATCLTIAAVH